jgi:SAM-dependent methyltransferase
MRRYEPERYWEERLSKDFSLGGVGYLRLGLEYNKWLYKARLRALSKVLKKNKIDVKGKRILDLGVGNGFYVEYWKKMRVSSITGVDITEKSTSSLKTKYPQYEFMQADISSKELRIQGTFDLITAFDVLFHIVDEDKFEQALSNIANLSHRDTQILITDSFLKESRPPSFHEYDRTMERYKEALSKVGIKPVVIVPVFYFMNNPIDMASIENKFMRGMLPFTWFAITRMCSLGNKLRLLGRSVNYLLGLILYLADGAILRYAKNGPGCKLLCSTIGR